MEDYGRLYGSLVIFEVLGPDVPRVSSQPIRPSLQRPHPLHLAHKLPSRQPPSPDILFSLQRNSQKSISHQNAISFDQTPHHPSFHPSPKFPTHISLSPLSSVQNREFQRRGCHALLDGGLPKLRHATNARPQAMIGHAGRGRPQPEKGDKRGRCAMCNKVL